MALIARVSFASCAAAGTTGDSRMLARIMRAGDMMGVWPAPESLSTDLDQGSVRTMIMPRMVPAGA